MDDEDMDMDSDDDMNDDDTIVQGGHGGHGSGDYHKYHIILVEESMAESPAVTTEMDTLLALFDTKGKGKDCLSKHSKLTGDFCLLHDLMNTDT